MTKLFLQAVMLMGVAIVVTLIGTRVFMDSPQDTVALELVGGHAQRVAKGIANTPPVERRAKAAALAKSLGYAVRLELAPKNADPAPRSEWRLGDLFVVARVPNTSGQIALGPLPTAQTTSIMGLLFLSLVVALLMAVVATVSIFRRVRSLERTAEQMGRGNFSARAEQSKAGASLFDRLSRALNGLADRIGQLLTDQSDLMRTVAHEVRAPITRMRFRVDKIHRSADAAQQETSAGLVSDLDQVNNLFGELLTYVAFDEFDHKRQELRTETIDVIEAVRQVVEEVTATEEETTVTVAGPEDAKVCANRKLFERALTNLLVNAMKYGGPQIDIEVREFEKECVIDVQDSGPGIPERDRPEVIKPFVRLTKTESKGTGLGLAIVTRIMQVHHGRLHLMNAPSGGASVQLVWKNATVKPRRRWPIGFFRHRTR